MQEISYLPGEGTVIVAGDTVLLLDAPPDAVVPRALWRLVAAGMNHQQVRAVLESTNPTRLPDLAVASLTGDGGALLLRGAARAAVTTPDATTQYADGGHSEGRMWTEVRLGPVMGVRLWLREPHPAARALPLVSGVVRADVVSVVSEPAPAGRPPPPPGPPPKADPEPPVPNPGAPAPRDAPAPPLEGLFVDRTSTAPSAPAAPAPGASLDELWVKPDPPAGIAPPVVAVAAPTEGQRPGVWASRCPYGHLNPPDAQFCRVCGQQLTDRDVSYVARPPLGRLDFGPLGSVVLDGDLLIGSDPGEQPVGAPQPVVVDHPQLSTRHIEVQVRGWTVSVVDLGSPYGTTVVLPGRAAKRLRARSPEPIVEGTVVWLGQQVRFTYRAAPE